MYDYCECCDDPGADVPMTREELLALTDNEDEIVEFWYLCEG